MTKEKIDEIIMNATKNNLLDLTNQFQNALKEIPNEADNPLARDLIISSIVQGNIMAALKEVCYEVLLKNN